MQNLVVISEVGKLRLEWGVVKGNFSFICNVIIFLQW